MTTAIRSIKNYYFPTTSQNSWKQPVGSKQMKQNLSYFISPVQFERIRHNVGMWREAVKEMELSWYPQRVRQQRLFQDTVINEHVFACWERRKDLTLLRDFKICNQKGVADEDLKRYFRNITSDDYFMDSNSAAWFDDFMSFALDAKGLSYTLISLGDLKNDAFPDISVIRRQNVSPDRLNVTSYTYSLSGQKFLEDPYRDWHVWVPTASMLGNGKCGYGLFYMIAKSEIFIRNNLQFNADFQEVFGQPIRVGKSSSTDETERGAFAGSLASMGSNPWVLLDETRGESLELKESKTIGGAYKSYADFEKRMQQNISKVLLGHADTMDSVPGKIGSQQGGEESPTSRALDDIQVKDGIFIQNVVNTKLIPRMRKMGFDIPLDYHFEFLNNQEDEEFRQREDASNLQTATIAMTMSQAGLKMSAEYFEERTGIETTDAPEPTPPTLPGQDPNAPAVPGKKAKPGKKDNGLKEKTKARLQKMYGVKNEAV